MALKHLFFTSKKNTNSTLWMQLAFIALGLVAFGALSFYAYRSYIVSRESEAQRAFAHAYETFTAAQNEGSQIAWQAAQSTLITAYEKHRSSTVAPVLKAFLADALLQQGKKDEALAAMNDACTAMSTSSSMYPYFAVKYALMRIDHGNEVSQVEGLKALEKLADKSNKNRDNALYQLGAYYAAHNDEQKAQTLWSELVASQTGTQDKWSNYAMMAQQKLQ